MKILTVLTSHDQLGNTGRKTGFWLEEFAVLVDAMIRWLRPRLSQIGLLCTS